MSAAGADSRCHFLELAIVPVPYKAVTGLAIT